MKILLVQPAYETTYWTYSEVHSLAGTIGHAPNIALPTLAAMAPDDVEITIHDEVAGPIDFEQKWDLVGITGYITQRRRMIAIADEFRKRGQLVAIGGPYATLSQSTMRPHADILFVGEAERIWPQFLDDFRNNSWKNEYRALEAVDFHASPLPDLSKMNQGEYMMGIVQTSRGCPFECEFCDVIVYLGRKQRHKLPERVVAELESFYQLGYRHVFLADDNLTANRKRCAEIMSGIIEWNRTKPERMTFMTQMSVDIARDQDQPLLELCSEAGLVAAFVGIESPDEAALRDIKKRQNLRTDLIEDIHRIQRRGIMVMGGMICGFDTDTHHSFVRTFEFLQEAGIPMATISILNAPEGTPLQHRLMQENRLSPDVDDAMFDTNIIPKLMTYEDLLTGYRWLLNRLYTPENFLQRCKVLAANSPSAKKSKPTRHALRLLQNILPAYKALGPDFASVPMKIASIFQDRDATSIGNILLYTLNLVKIMQKKGMWDPELGQMPEPDFQAAMV